MPKSNCFVVIILLLSLLLFVAGCGRNETEPESIPASTATPATTSGDETRSADETADTAPVDNVNQEGATNAESPAPDAQDQNDLPTDSANDDINSETDRETNGDTNDATNGQTQPALSGEIVLWHSWAGAEGDALALILQEFQTRYPGVQVETLFIAHDDLLQSYAEAVFAEGGPTLLLAPNWWLGEMVLLQLLAPFGPELAQTTLEGLFPAALDSMLWDDTLYGVPIHVTAPAVYVNTDLYDGDMPQTLEEWQTLAAQDPQYGIGLYANLYHLAWGLDAYGASLFDEQGRVVLNEHEGAVDFLYWLRRVNELDGSFVDQDYGMLLDRYNSGEFAFFVDGPWSYGDLTAALDGAVTVAPLPDGPAGPARPWLYADGLFLNPSAENDTRRIAVTFAQHLASPAAGEILADTGNLLPANRTLTLPPDHRLAGFHAQAESAAAMPTRREMDTAWGYGGDMIIRAILGYPELDTEAEAEALAQELASLVEETATLINEANGR